MTIETRRQHNESNEQRLTNVSNNNNSTSVNNTSSSILAKIPSKQHLNHYKRLYDDKLNGKNQFAYKAKEFIKRIATPPKIDKKNADKENKESSLATSEKLVPKISVSNNTLPAIGISPVINRTAIASTQQPSTQQLQQQPSVPNELIIDEPSLAGTSMMILDATTSTKSRKRFSSTPLVTKEPLLHKIQEQDDLDGSILAETAKNKSKRQSSDAKEESKRAKEKSAVETTTINDKSKRDKSKTKISERTPDKASKTTSFHQDVYDFMNNDDDDDDDYDIKTQQQKQQQHDKSSKRDKSKTSKTVVEENNITAAPETRSKSQERTVHKSPKASKTASKTVIEATAAHETRAKSQERTVHKSPRTTKKTDTTKQTIPHPVDDYPQQEQQQDAEEDDELVTTEKNVIKTKKHQKKDKKRKLPAEQVAPEEHDHEADGDDDDDGLRRSKRARVNAWEVPQYKPEVVRDHDGNVIIVNKLVGKTTKNTGRYSLEKVLKSEKRKRAHNTTSQDKSKRAKTEQSVEQQEQEEDERARRKRLKKEERKRLRKEQIRAERQARHEIREEKRRQRRLQRALEQQQQQSLDAEIPEPEQDDNEDIENMLDKSTEFVKVKDPDTNEYIEWQLFERFSNITKRKYIPYEDGVSLTATSEREGILKIEPGAALPATSRETASTYMCHVGSVYVIVPSIKDKKYFVNERDSVKVPKNMKHIIKNSSKDTDAYIAFRLESK